MNNLEKKVRAALILCVILMGIYLAGKCFTIWERKNEGRGEQILGKAYVQAGTAAAGAFLPGTFYEPDETPENFFSSVLEVVREQFPVLSIRETDCGQERIVEDEKTARAVQKIEKKLQEENQTETDRDGGKENTEDAGGEARPPESGEGQEAPAEEETSQAAVSSPQPPEGTALVKQVEIPKEQLVDFHYLLNNFFVVDPTTTALESQINADTLLGKDMKLAKDPANPQILIYHTHSQEEYADSVPGDPSTTVIGVGDYLVQLLQERYGYQVLHITDPFDIVNGQLDRSAAYNYAEPVVSQALQEHPSIEIVIDLHRDGVDASKHLVTEVNGKPTAQVMFFNGLSRTNQNGEISYLPNPYIEDNLAFSFQLEYLAKQYYPDYTRCIYLKGYRYNLHLKPRSLLLEVGAQTNTVEEAKNAMEPFADLLYKVLNGTG